MIQIDMPMPENCRMCPSCSEYDICLIPIDGKGFGEPNVSEFIDSRPEWCPLKEQKTVKPINIENDIVYGLSEISLYLSNIGKDDFVKTIEYACKKLELLKEHEARILDWDELEDWGNAVWFEDKDEHECYIALIANVGTYDAKFTNVEPGNIHSLDFMRDFYMKEWRCWSARPTIKQRQETKWDELEK